MEDKEKQEKVFDILNKFEFFHGQRAGRELWNDKPKEVQDKDIADFIKDINYIRSYLQDSVVLSREEYEKLKNESIDKLFADDAFFKEEFKANEEYLRKRASRDYIKLVKKQSSKETAEKILKEVNEFFRPFDKKSPIFLDLLLTKLETVVKKFGVEITE